MIDITVAIPTYNGENRLPEVLDRLKAQINTESIRWEVIVVDNNSTDNTAKIVRQYQQDWPQAYPLKYYFAPEQGAAFARERAIEVAQGEFVGFLDDDNLPTPNWVAEAHRFSQDHPKIGAFGSQIHGQFESALPPNLKRVAPFLAIIERGSQAHLYEPQSKILPPGAGLVVRKQAWQDSVPKRLFLNNKGKDAGLASEDLEVLLYIQRQGWEIWYNPEMVVYHKIPDSRLQKEYLVLLFRCVGLSRFYIRMLGVKGWQRPLVLPAYIANDLRKLALHLIKHGNTAEVDVMAACEREHLVTTLASPLFLLKKVCADAMQIRQGPIYSTERQDWMKQIAEAFEQDQLCLYQQTVAGLGALTTSKHCVEVLLRIRKQTDAGPQLLPPAQFLSAAERFNLVQSIDRWVVRQLFESVSQHYEQMSETERCQKPHLYSINLSGASLKGNQFVNFLKEQLTLQSIPPSWICFEITEKVAIANLKDAARLAQEIRALGCRVALDDVGQRNTSLAHLKKIPVDFLKINGQFVRNITSNLSDLKRTATINQIGHKMGAQTVAKSVETSKILEKIKTLGIDYAQGHSIAMPQPLNLPQFNSSQAKEVLQPFVAASTMVNSTMGTV